MAGQGTMRDAVRRLDRAVRSFAASRGWGPGDYRAYVWVDETWGQINLLLVVKSLPGKDPEVAWLAVIDYLDSDLKDDPALRDALHLSLRTFENVSEGGIYSIGESFVPIEEWVSPSATA